MLYIASMLPHAFDAFLGRLHVVDLVDGAIREVLGDWGEIGMAAWLPDSKQIVITGKPHGTQIGAKSDLWLTDRDGAVLVCRTAGLKVGVGGGLEPDMPVNTYSDRVLRSSDGQFALINVQDGGTVGIYRVALHGNEAFTPVVTGDRTCYPLDATDTYLLYSVSDFNLRPDLYLSNTEGKHEKRLSDLNHDLLAGLTLPAVERLQFPGSDGTPVEGWLWTPRHTGIAPFPTILLNHGGPHGAWGHISTFMHRSFAGPAMPCCKLTTAPRPAMVTLSQQRLKVIGEIWIKRT